MERFIALRAAGIVLGFAGAAVLVLPRGSLPSPDLLPIALLAFVTPALWAVANIFAELARPTDGKPYALAMGTMYPAAADALVGDVLAALQQIAVDGFRQEARQAFL